MNFRLYFIRVLVLAIIFQFTAYRGSAQDKAGGIAFFSGSWKEVLEEARRRGKPVMVDIYTTWCLPCKKMDKEVFPQPEIGGKYNQSFICYKADAEKGEGIGLKNKYEVSAYPTYLFINEDGVLLHKAVGYHPPADFLKVADEAEKMAKATETVRSLQQQYEKGNRDPAFMRSYINKLGSLALGKTQRVLLDEYIAILPEKKQDEIKEIGFILKNLTTADSKAFSVIADHQLQAIEALEQDRTLHTAIPTGNMQNKLGTILCNATIQSMMEAISQRDTSLLNIIRVNSRKIRNPGLLYPYTFFAFQLQFYKTARDTAGLLQISREFLNNSSYLDSSIIAQKNQQSFDNFMSDYLSGKQDSTTEKDFEQQKLHYSRRCTKEAARMLDLVARFYYERISSPQDLQQGIDWSRKSILLINDEPSFYQTLANLLSKAGQQKNAITSQETALRIARAQQRNEKEIGLYQQNLETLRSGKRVAVED